LIKTARAFLERQAHAPALGWRQGSGKAGDLGNLTPPRQERQRDERQHRADSIVRVVIARVWCLTKHI